MGDTRTLHDPFLNKQVQISSNIVDRLRGKYAVGPTMENGEPEFGWRHHHEMPPIQSEAADEIERLREENKRIKNIIRRAAPAIERHWAMTAGGPKKSDLLALRREADEVVSTFERSPP